MNDMTKNIILWAIIAVVLISILQGFGQRMPMMEKMVYSEFLHHVEQGAIRSIVIDGQAINGRMTGGETFRTYSPNKEQDQLIQELRNSDIRIEAQEPRKQSLLLQIFISWFPFLLLIGVWIFFMRQMQGGGAGRGAMSFGKSKAKLLGEDQIRVTFADVAGVDEAKDEVLELVEFLRDPGKFQRLGGRIPRGVLMVGPPGTGKTLLARAIAGEAKVPFFSISGSDFVEMFVGVGASRVRDMFEQAKKQSPCIIFIDEIDAVGRHRGVGLGGGHDEREQTLNQLLVEMDGFQGNEGVIIIAATNRPDVLDRALLRPGRFDRQVVVGLPDVRGREQILRVHMKKIPTETDVEPGIIARGTPGFTGADLANLVNEAALFAARRNHSAVDMKAFERAKDKIMMGVERRSMVMNEDERKLTAYHEAGHAIVGLLVPDHDSVYKVSIMPRGQALGITMFLPEDDRYSYSKRRLYSQLSSLFGGRAAEEVVFGSDAVTTGASNDIERATEIARNIVTRWGLSDVLGPLSYHEEKEGSSNMHGGLGISDETARRIDHEIRSVIELNYERARELLLEHIDSLHMMAEALMKYETIDKAQIDDIMSGRMPGPPKGWGADDSASQVRLDKPAQPSSGGAAVPVQSKVTKKSDSDKHTVQS